MKIAVGMSGGVDSTMAAYLLKKQGHEVQGITMKIWSGRQDFKAVKNSCYGPGEAQRLEGARKACEKIGIPHHVIDLSADYEQTVLKYFSEEYARGRTPNPCVMCNARMKFGLLLTKALESGLDFEYFATGHYIRKEYDSELKMNVLKVPHDKSKDQTYFLYRLNNAQIEKVLFPLSELSKPEVKKLATESGFAEYALKHESQNFAECKSYSELLPGHKGQIVDTTGKFLGEHEGIVNYTIGQRKGLDLGGLKEPYYVLKIDAEKNLVVVGLKDALYGQTAKVDNLNFLVPLAKVKNRELSAKCRYRAPLARCLVLDENEKEITVRFFEPQLALTPGQSLVLYAGDILVGGGFIV